MFLNSSSSTTTSDNGNDDSRLENLENSSNLDKSDKNNSIMRKELVLMIFAFLITVYAGLQSNSPKISRPVAPSPFFRKG